MYIKKGVNKPTSSTSIAMLLEKQRKNKRTKKRTAQPFLNAMCGIIPCPVCPLPLSQFSPIQFLYAACGKNVSIRKKRKEEKKRGRKDRSGPPLLSVFYDRLRHKKALACLPVVVCRFILSTMGSIASWLLVDLPVIVLVRAQVELDTVQDHGQSDISPLPVAALDIAAS